MQSLLTGFMRFSDEKIIPNPAPKNEIALRNFHELDLIEGSLSIL